MSTVSDDEGSRRILFMRIATATYAPARADSPIETYARALIYRRNRPFLTKKLGELSR